MAEVFDGDTLLLSDGRRIRLIGINTPETGWEEKPDEPHAKAAKRRLERLVSDSGKRIRLEKGHQQKDRYRRILAHVYSQNGKNLIEALLQDGAGFQIVFPPNLDHLQCYGAAESRARAAGRGVWADVPVIEAARLARSVEGFRLLHGRVEESQNSRRSIWLKLAGVKIRIDRSDLDYFNDWQPKGLLGQLIEVRGWIRRYKGHQRIRVRHPSAIKVAW
ncbi:MAG: thermonuclease family protein [gamma proteobacterium endosymbiont of Lamellibrachia anaximandri]|nr:thermonuclease family protein [gamma proteobacterium endosymbiont of Lamellibrachia anaximandri]MBL3619119.1 thermonuclease family protein [gamma proteobacterium endosymbiont of Lamellibrachia anaximandri]